LIWVQITPSGLLPQLPCNRHNSSSRHRPTPCSCREGRGPGPTPLLLLLLLLLLLWLSRLLEGRRLPCTAPRVGVHRWRTEHIVHPGPPVAATRRHTTALPYITGAPPLRLRHAVLLLPLLLRRRRRLLEHAGFVFLISI
jgi:hypothetical protein